MNTTSHLIRAFAAAFLATTAPVRAGGFLEDVGKAIGKGVSDGGNAIAKGVSDGGNAVAKGVNDSVNAVGKGINDGGNAIAKGVSDGGNAIGKGINDGVNAIVKGVDDTGHTLEKATHDTGNALEQATHDTGHALEGAGQFVKDHPWETVIGVALIAGGGYLILYQGYALTISVQGVQVVSVTAASATGATSGIVITAGATSGVLTGSAAAIAGAGTIALGYYKDGPHSEAVASGAQTSGRDFSGGTPASQESRERLGSSLSAVLNLSNRAVPNRSVVFQGNSHPRVVIAAAASAQSSGQPTAAATGRPVMPAIVSPANSSIMVEPWQPKNPTDMQRYNYASRVSAWAQKTMPPEKFDPDTLYSISRVELRILDALASLQSIGAAGDEQAEEQRQSRVNPLPDLAKEQATETGKSMTLSLLKGQNPGKVLTLTKQAEIFWGTAGAGKTAATAAAPEAVAALGLVGLLEVGTVYGPFLASTAVSDGIKESSEGLAADLRNKLDAYNRQREKKFGSPAAAKAMPTQTVINQPQGPVLKAAP
jgi:hypothetical protein